MTNLGEKKKQLARILKSLLSSDDRLERGITALEEAAGNNEEQEALERNPSKCNSGTVMLNSNVSPLSPK